jgi:hypothetical protein
MLFCGAALTVLSGTGVLIGYIQKQISRGHIYEHEHYPQLHSVVKTSFLFTFESKQEACNTGLVHLGNGFIHFIRKQLFTRTGRESFYL